MRSLFATLLIVTFPVVHAAPPPKKYNEQLESINLLVCSGSELEATNALRKLIEDDPNNVDAVLLQDYLIEYVPSEEVDEVLSRLDRMNEIERLRAVGAFLRERTDKLNALREILNFKSDSTAIESYRLLLEGTIDGYVGDLQAAISKARTSYDIYEYIDAVTLVWLLQVPGGTDKEFLLEAIKYLEVYPENHPDYFNLRAHFNLKSDTPANKQALKDFEKAYELCPRDEAIAFDYAYALAEESNFTQAREVLEGVVRRSQYYGVEVDFMLAQIYVYEGRASLARKYLDLVETSQHYLGREWREQIPYIRSELSRVESRTYKNIFLGLVAAVLMGFGFILWGKWREADDKASN